MCRSGPHHRSAKLYGFAVSANRRICSSVTVVFMVLSDFLRVDDWVEGR